MSERTPVSRIVETIKQVAVMQEQIARLVEAMTRLAVRVEAIESVLKRHAGS
jgi:hypothetical protein